MFLIYKEKQKNWVNMSKSQKKCTNYTNIIKRDIHFSRIIWTKIEEFYDVKWYQRCGQTRYSYTVMEMYNPFEREI